MREWIAMTANFVNTSSKIPDETIVDNGKDALCQQLEEEVYDLIKDITDPEKPQTLEELNVVYENGVSISQIEGGYHIKIEFTPTVPHCSLAALIGLCLRTRLQRSLAENFKLDISIKEGTHSTLEEINKQINDKERVAAAMENPDLKNLVEKCLEQNSY